MSAPSCSGRTGNIRQRSAQRRAAGTLYFMSPAPVIIAIDGRSGSGKTTLAIELAARLREHHKVSLFHLEDIYPGWNGLAAGIERYVATVLSPLRRGETAEWVSWDWERHYDGEARTTRPAEIVLVEGVGAAAAAARPLLDAVIWADSSDADRRARALARDGDTYEPFWDQWAAQEAEWLAADDVPAHADVHVAQPRGRHRPGRRPASPPVPSRASPPRCCPSSPPAAGSQLRAERIEAAPDAARLFEALFGGSANAVWLDSSLDPAGLAPEAAGTQPLQHPGRRRRPLRPGGPAQFRHDPRQRGPGHGDHRRPVLPLARRRLGPPRRSAPPKATRASSPWAGSGTSATNSSARPAAAMSAAHHPGRLPDLRRPRRGAGPCRSARPGCWPWTRPTPTTGSAAARRGAVTGAASRRRRGAGLPAGADAGARRRSPRRLANFTATGHGSRLQGQDRRGPARDRRGQHLRGLPDHRPHGVRPGAARTAPDPWQTYLALRRRNPAPSPAICVRRPHSGQHLAGALPAASRPTAACGPSRSKAPAAGTRTRPGRGPGQELDPRPRTAPRTS